LATVIIANFVMVAVMTMAPARLHSQGHGLEFIGFVVSLHVAGMFGPSPLTGWLTDQLGSPPAAALCAVAIMVSGILLAVGGHGGASFAVGLFLLGVGWNAGLIAGSTLVAAGVPVSERPRAEGVGDVGMGVAAACATAVAGPIAGVAGYATLALTAAVPANRFR
jgi:MFS family permease